MTELQLYKFIKDNIIASNIFRDDTTGEIKEVFSFIPFYLIEDFVLLLEGYTLIDNPLECFLKKDSLCVEMTQVCEYFQIEPENIFK